ncbi:auxiliary transport protein, membrane fusion protein (MFP) family protein [delta proteobacterium NaphS2]|nr:auxiliary transport protein, membrane fusion protein (MFP) family protein [delta proteobacterium NaphS2]
MKKKQKIRRIVLLPAIALVIGAGAYFYTHGESEPENRLDLYGNVDIRQVQLAFHATGRIEKLSVQEGDAVKPGQLVAELDPIRYEAAVAKASAEVAAKNQVLSRLLAGSRPEVVREARERVKAEEANLADAKALYERMKFLVRTGSTSKQKFDDAERAFKAARANLKAAKQELILAVKGPRKEDIALARAQLRAGEAALKLAERELTDTKLYAPEAGVIQNRILEPGDMAFPETPVFTLALTNPVWVRAYISEPDLGKVAPGMRAYLTTDSFPGKKYEGWIGFISPTAEFTPKQVQTTELRTKLVYRLRIYACNPRNELRLGMPVTVTVSLNQPLENVAGNRRPCQKNPDDHP